MTASGERETLRLTLQEMGDLGECLAVHDGSRVFVFGGIPGEEVEAEVLRRLRRRLEARAVRVLQPSPYRVEPPCPYYGACTGCQWQHIAYPYQLELKRLRVVRALERVPELAGARVSPTLPAPDPFGYRNHARFTVGPGGTLGFVNRTTREFVRVDRCLLMHPGINDLLAQLQGRCAETTQLSIRYGVKTGSWLVQPRLESPEVPIPTGQEYYEEALLGRRFRVHNASFFQVNTHQAERLVDLVRERLALSGREFLVDAYAGVGTFAILLAPYARRVVAIEESPSAVRDARANAQGLENVEFLQGKTEEVLGALPERPQALVLDPPRAGCHPSALSALNALAPDRVVYVSCEPVTLARDLQVLVQGAFRLVEVQPIDLFPQTYHVECVALLVRKEG